MMTVAVLLASATLFAAAPHPVESFAEAKPVWLAGDDGQGYCADAGAAVAI